MVGGADSVARGNALGAECALFRVSFLSFLSVFSLPHPLHSCFAAVRPEIAVEMQLSPVSVRDRVSWSWLRLERRRSGTGGEGIWRRALPSDYLDDWKSLAQRALNAETKISWRSRDHVVSRRSKRARGVVFALRNDRVASAA